MIIEELVARDSKHFPKGVRASFSRGLNIVLGSSERHRFLFSLLCSPFKKSVDEGVIRLKISSKDKQATLLYDASTNLKKVLGVEGEIPSIQLADISILDFEEGAEREEGVEDLERADIRKMWMEEEIRGTEFKEESLNIIRKMKDELEKVESAKSEIEALESRKEEIQKFMDKAPNVKNIESKLPIFQTIERVYGRERDRVTDDIRELQKALKTYKQPSFWKTWTFMLGAMFSLIPLLAGIWRLYSGVYRTEAWFLIPLVFSIGIVLLLVTFVRRVRASDKIAWIEAELKEKVETRKIIEKALGSAKNEVIWELGISGMSLDEIKSKIKEIKEREEELKEISANLEKLRGFIESRDVENMHRSIQELEETLKQIETTIPKDELLKELEKLKPLLEKAPLDKFLEETLPRCEKLGLNVNEQKLMGIFSELAESIRFGKVELRNLRPLEVYIRGKRIPTVELTADEEKIVSTLLCVSISLCLEDHLPCIFYQIPTQIDERKFLDRLSEKTQVILFSERKFEVGKVDKILYVEGKRG